MTESIYDRIDRRIAELDTTAHAVSVSAGLDRGYLAKLVGRRGMPNSDALGKLAKALDTTVSWLLDGTDSPQPKSASGGETPPSIERRTRAETQAVSRDLPLLRGEFTLRADGLFRLPAEPSDWLYRTPALKAFPEAYGLVIPNATLRPKFDPGELVLACPGKPPRKGDAVIVRLGEDRDNANAALGTLADDITHEVLLTVNGQQQTVAHATSSLSSVDKLLSLQEIMGLS
ncbi:helix-turn-helix transcriptional regulator [Pararhizobium sp. BT-229]|uniref:helix-turn-helix domain-containing protein n=1 Tax=Pararhizobium sp. BT-229 TaxID=2986923 RepID=UPI0021F7025D|nr:helix-turn-helix transcriptional regulator [Pararhizobium sp. BT-229]MCV9964610.1 helix-turn-helix transcriptional regulator [Pararhizobium sp. BT-229]